MIVGVLGSGQLARMLALAGHPLGLTFVFFGPDGDACAAPLGRHVCTGFDDNAALATFARQVDVVTYEFENVPAEALQTVAACVAVYPPPAALAAAQDRLREKRLFRELGIPTPAFAPVSSLQGAGAAMAEVGLPAMLKTRTHGYDGKGQKRLQAARDIEPAWQRIGRVPAILEAFVPFQREVSVIAVRGRQGDTAFYPLVENTHHNGILRLSVGRRDDPMQSAAEDYARRLLDRLGYVGVVAIEFFQVGDGLIANEFAPRVHNSGHWTSEGAATSQFENHLRAILGLPLGSTDPVGHAAMVNLIGELPDPARFLSIPNVHLHVYGKQPRPGRKLGHVTLRTESEQDLKAGLDRMMSLTDG